MTAKSALIVVDMQNDFFPPDGSLAVDGARDIVPLINRMLKSPVFTIKVATQDYHPPDHISFASNHPADVQPFRSSVEIRDHIGAESDRTMQLRVWPDHCVQHTKGAQFVDELDESNVDIIVKKGMDAKVEMYSAFHDSFENMTAGRGGVSLDLAQTLKANDIVDVYIVGLAGDYCVKGTAIGAARAGFSTFLVEPAQRCVNAESWSQIKAELENEAVRVIDLGSKQWASLNIA